MPVSIVFTDESVNRYGFRVLNTAFSLKKFESNAVLYWGHKSDGAPLGKWVDIKELNGAISGTPDIDTGDAFGADIERKVAAGYINAASMGIRIIEVSEDPMLMLPNQTRPTVTKCDLLEVSLVGIPANANAVRLFNENNEEINLSAIADNGNVSSLDFLLPEVETKKIKKMQGIIEKLGLGSDATEAQIIEAIAAKDSRIAGLQADLQQVKLEAGRSKAAVLVEAALSAKKITAAQKSQWEKLAAADFDSAKTALEGMTGYVSPNELIRLAAAGGAGESLSDAAQYDELASSGKLVALKNSNPVEFAKLQKAKVASLK